MPVFPWSMSDFKPGDRYFERAISELVQSVFTLILLLCPYYAQTFFMPTPGLTCKSESGF